MPYIKKNGPHDGDPNYLSTYLFLYERIEYVCTYVYSCICIYTHVYIYSIHAYMYMFVYIYI